MAGSNTKSKLMIVDSVAGAVCHYYGLKGSVKTTVYRDGTGIDYETLPFHDPKYLTSVYTHFKVGVTPYNVFHFMHVGYSFIFLLLACRLLHHRTTSNLTSTYAQGVNLTLQGWEAFGCRIWTTLDKRWMGTAVQVGPLHPHSEAHSLSPPTPPISALSTLNPCSMWIGHHGSH
jgi:hypothetical protein